MREYPRYKYHPDGRERLVLNQIEDEEPGWFDNKLLAAQSLENPIFEKEVVIVQAPEIEAEAVKPTLKAKSRGKNGNSSRPN